MSTTARHSALGFAIASLVLGASAPAFAHSTPAMLADGSRMTLDQSSGNFCLSEKITGSNVPVVTCKSQSDWAKDGLAISVK
ncbi:hypothetical protein HZF05_13360 [Sphingomonas sp. CGMCC 1.13654]|uniref:Ricin B lectin domain-containing protein n=1 Tax=Sphingomonas chungangi TaxID=2683589 RepID=A0A838L6H6_9SPHN|nr:hypothetical protein [Sphingomonas chungangi]MBA2935083.1 hypothetical protein [Sphingomonas chungangi]MVW54199.1 hypothetical protein [Sphingomonas chungangi]